MPPTKCCSQCGASKELTEFRRDRTKRDGHHSICKRCRVESDAEQKLRKRYGLTRQDWEVMHRHQKGLCLICQREPEEPLQVDHCHKSLRIRGLLCGTCNRAIGLLKESAEIIARAALYVARHQGTP